MLFEYEKWPTSATFHDTGYIFAEKEVKLFEILIKNISIIIKVISKIRVQIGVSTFQSLRVLVFFTLIRLQP